MALALILIYTLAAVTWSLGCASQTGSWSNIIFGILTDCIAGRHVALDEEIVTRLLTNVAISGGEHESGRNQDFLNVPEIRS